MKNMRTKFIGFAALLMALMMVPAFAYGTVRTDISGSGVTTIKETISTNTAEVNQQITNVGAVNVLEEITLNQNKIQQGEVVTGIGLTNIKTEINSLGPVNKVFEATYKMNGQQTWALETTNVGTLSYNTELTKLGGVVYVKSVGINAPLDCTPRAPKAPKLPSCKTCR
jgi:hypothetical protein